MEEGAGGVLMVVCWAISRAGPIITSPHLLFQEVNQQPQRIYVATQSLLSLCWTEDMLPMELLFTL